MFVAYFCLQIGQFYCHFGNDQLDCEGIEEIAAVLLLAVYIYIILGTHTVNINFIYDYHAPLWVQVCTKTSVVLHLIIILLL